ncbi:unnamed protein product [Amoebophrya sp. A120]|nr:unnamed protein product [Amoebophrya sp. A120]|eukprot:GSA120T00005002001.1
MKVELFARGCVSADDDPQHHVVRLQNDGLHFRDSFIPVAGLFAAANNQEAVFERVCFPHLREQKNATFLFFGAPGSGKTHTVEGKWNTPDLPEHGLLPRALHCLCVPAVSSASSQREKTPLEASFVEFSDGGMFDLLAGPPNEMAGGSSSSTSSGGSGATSKVGRLFSSPPAHNKWNSRNFTSGTGPSINGGNPAASSNALRRVASLENALRLRGELPPGQALAENLSPVEQGQLELDRLRQIYMQGAMRKSPQCATCFQISSADRKTCFRFIELPFDDTFASCHSPTETATRLRGSSLKQQRIASSLQHNLHAFMECLQVVARDDVTNGAAAPAARKASTNTSTPVLTQQPRTHLARLLEMRGAAALHTSTLVVTYCFRLDRETELRAALPVLQTLSELATVFPKQVQPNAASTPSPAFSSGPAGSGLLTRTNEQANLRLNHRFSSPQHLISDSPLVQHSMLSALSCEPGNEVVDDATFKVDVGGPAELVLEQADAAGSGGNRSSNIARGTTATGTTSTSAIFTKAEQRQQQQRTIDLLAAQVKHLSTASTTDEQRSTTASTRDQQGSSTGAPAQAHPSSSSSASRGVIGGPSSSQIQPRPPEVSMSNVATIGQHSEAGAHSELVSPELVNDDDPTQTRHDANSINGTKNPTAYGAGSALTKKGTRATFPFDKAQAAATSPVLADPGPQIAPIRDKSTTSPSVPAEFSHQELQAHNIMQQAPACEAERPRAEPQLLKRTSSVAANRFPRVPLTAEDSFGSNCRQYMETSSRFLKLVQEEYLPVHDQLSADIVQVLHQLESLRIAQYAGKACHGPDERETSLKMLLEKIVLSRTIGETLRFQHDELMHALLPMGSDGAGATTEERLRTLQVKHQYVSAPPAIRLALRSLRRGAAQAVLDENTGYSVATSSKSASQEEELCSDPSSKLHPASSLIAKNLRNRGILNSMPGSTVTSGGARTAGAVAATTLFPASGFQHGGPQVVHPSSVPPLALERLPPPIPPDPDNKPCYIVNPSSLDYDEDESDADIIVEQNQQTSSVQPKGPSPAHEVPGNTRGILPQHAHLAAPPAPAAVGNKSGASNILVSGAGILPRKSTSTGSGSVSAQQPPIANQVRPTSEKPTMLGGARHFAEMLTSPGLNSTSTPGSGGMLGPLSGGSSSSSTGNLTRGGMQHRGGPASLRTQSGTNNNMSLWPRTRLGMSPSPLRCTTTFQTLEKRVAVSDKKDYKHNSDRERPHAHPLNRGTDHDSRSVGRFLYAPPPKMRLQSTAHSLNTSGASNNISVSNVTNGTTTSASPSAGGATCPAGPVAGRVSPAHLRKSSSTAGFGLQRVGVFTPFFKCNQRHMSPVAQQHQPHIVHPRPVAAAAR